MSTHYIKKNAFIYCVSFYYIVKYNAMEWDNRNLKVVKKIRENYQVQSCVILQITRD